MSQIKQNKRSKIADFSEIRSYWTGFPLCFLGYGFLYAWGYASWETPALSTQAYAIGNLDPSWFASALVVPLVLIIIAFSGFRWELDRFRALYLVAPTAAVLGSILSVIYQYTPITISPILAASSGVCTGLASALFSVLWALVLSRLNANVVEVIIPGSFVVSLLCSLLLPSLSTIPALIMILLLALLCSWTLVRSKAHIDAGSVTSRYLDDGHLSFQVSADTRPFGITRMLVYGIVAWALSSFVPGLLSSEGRIIAGIDLVSLIGYALAIVFALVIIHYAIRVDFQALAFMTLAPFILSIALCAPGGFLSDFFASVLNVAMGACFEIILLLFFIHLAQVKRIHRTFYLAIGSAASYLGVFVGTLLSFFTVSNSGMSVEHRMLSCLTLICIYAFAVLLIPQRQLYTEGSLSFKVLDRSTSQVAGQGAADVGNNSAKELSEGESLFSQENVTILSRMECLCLDGASVPDLARDAIDLACDKISVEYRLSMRESQMCAFLAHGRSQTYIRDALFLSKNTIATHARHLYTKLNVHSKQELINLVERYK